MIVDDINVGVTEGQVADVPVDNSSVDTSVDNAPVDGGSEPNDSQSNAKPVQDKETNAAFAEMRRAREAAEKQAGQYQKDLNIARKYGAEWGLYSEADIVANYGESHGITTFEQFEQVLKAQQEAERLNVDPKLYQEFQTTKQTAQEALEKLSKYERRELLQKQADEISKDSKWGSFFNSNKDDILKTADAYGVDLQTAKLLVLEQKFEQPNVDEIKQNAVKEYIEKIKSGNAPVEGGGNTSVVASGTPKTFDEARKQAMAYLRGAIANKT